MICKNPKCKKSFRGDYPFCPWCGCDQSVEPDTNLTNYTLEQIFEMWKEEHYPLIEKKGVEGYKTAWNRLSILKDARFRELKTMHYQMVVNQVTSEGLSRASAEKIQHLVSQLCQFGIKNDILERNYGMFLVLPKAQKSSRDRFSDDELTILWQNASDQTVRIILILAYTGFRVNELFSIKKEDVHLNETIPYIIGGNKTEAGRNRTVVISTEILPFITEAYNTDEIYLFANNAGHPLDPGNWRKRRYYPTLERLNLPKREIHCLRHTFASMMMKCGADPKSIAQMMGHTKISTTADIYAHADLNQLSHAIEKLPKFSS